MATLPELLEQNLGFDPEYRGGLLTNHLSMCLVALDRLGATPSRLQGFFEAYRPPLEPLHDDAGRRERLRRKLQAVGRQVLLRERLPQLIAGLGGAAFHGLIRLAYAIEADHDAEIVQALAYFEESQMPLEPSGTLGEGDEAEPAVLLGRLHALQLPRPQAANIALRMQAAAANAGVRGVTALLAIDARALARLARASLSLYAASDDFTALHAVTASHAARLIAPFVEKEPLARSLWQALCAAYLASGSPRLLEQEAAAGLRERPVPEWPEIAARAIETNDDHVAKITWSCRSEDESYGDPLYRVVAWRAAARGRA